MPSALWDTLPREPAIVMWVVSIQCRPLCLVNFIAKRSNILSKFPFERLTATVPVKALEATFAFTMRKALQAAKNATVSSEPYLFTAGDLCLLISQICISNYYSFGDTNYFLLFLVQYRQTNRQTDNGVNFF